MKFFYLIFIVSILLSCQKQKGEYVCTPCDLECDELSFDKPGICPHCKMLLIKRTEVDPESNFEVNEINIQNGSGIFLIEGGSEKAKTIIVYYHKPQNFTIDSKSIFIIPGAGRNGRNYRDAWVDQSEKYGLVVLSLEYPEKYYPEFWSYNLGGMINDVNIENETFEINQNSEDWIFGDFDRIFNNVKAHLSLSKITYDMFGHSAGGQILHRLALFNSENQADRIIAANAGWYTLPSDQEKFPYGLEDLNITEGEIDYGSKLTIFLGEKDDASETRGQLRHSPEADKQGLHRLARGSYFYNQSKGIAEKFEKEFNWNIEIIPGIGHDYEEMSLAAGKYLYGE